MIEKILEQEEKVMKSMPMRFVPDDVGYDDLWVKDTLHFTNKRLIWNIKEKGVFSKKITFDDMPYQAIRGIDKEQSPRSGGLSGVMTMFKKGGTILVNSVVGSRQFQFDDEDTLREAERFLRQALIAPMTVVAMAVPRAAGGAEAAPAEEKTGFDVVLTGDGDKKFQVVKVVRELTGLGWKDAKDLVEAVPKPVKEGVSKEDAAAMKKKIEEAGGKVEVR